MLQFITSSLKVIKRTLLEWIDQDIHRLGAALSFYALFSIPPLFVVVLVMTALLFNLGKFLFSQYLLRIDVTSAYGAASSLVIALLWIYYSAQVLLFGAKFTQVYADMNRAHVDPALGAEAIIVEKVVSEHRPVAQCQDVTPH